MAKGTDGKTLSSRAKARARRERSALAHKRFLAAKKAKKTRQIKKLAAGLISPDMYAAAERIYERRQKEREEFKVELIVKRRAIAKHIKREKVPKKPKSISDLTAADLGITDATPRSERILIARQVATVAREGGELGRQHKHIAAICGLTPKEVYTLGVSPNAVIA